MTTPGRAGVVLAIDFGSRTTVGVLTDTGGPRLVGVDGQPWIQSAVYADVGGLVVGTDAVRLARLDPTRFEPSPKRRIDDGEVLLGTEVVSVSTLIDAVIGRVVAETSRQLGGRPIDGLVLTHPAQWGNVRQGLLRSIGQRYAPRLVLVPEPVAAAMYFAATTGFPVGATLAVYDLGAGTFDAAVVRRNPQGFEVLASDGIADLGGIDMDQRLFDHVGEKARAQNPQAWADLIGETAGTAESRRRLRTLRDDISSAKETLSRRLEIDIPFPSPFTDVHVTRTEYEGLIRADVQRSVEVLAETIAAAGATPQSLHSIHFVGGATRTPLCATLIEERLGVAPVPMDQPETVVALGAVRAILPPPGQVQAQSGRTGTYAAELGTGPSTGTVPAQPVPLSPQSGALPVPRPMPLPPGQRPRPVGPHPGPPRTRPVVPPQGTRPASGPPSGVQPTPFVSSRPAGGGPPSGGVHVGAQEPPRKSRRTLYLVAAATAVVVAVAAVLVIVLTGGSDDSAAQDLTADQALDLAQQVLPKSAIPDGYSLDDPATYKATTSIDRSRAGYVCIPQEDAPLPAEAGITAVASMDAVEAGGPNATRPRDQVFLGVSYVDSAQRTKLLSQIRTKIKQCHADAPTKTYETYDYAEDSVSGIDGDQVGFTATLPSTTDENGTEIPAEIVTCQIARVDALVLRSCAITTKDELRQATGGFGTDDSSDGKNRAAKTVADQLQNLAKKAKAVQGL